MKLSDDNKKDWLLLKKAFKSQWNSLTFTFHEIRRESGLLNELLLYIPFLVTVIFFVYTNRISHFYHNFGNYGFEETFLSGVQPVVKDLLAGRFRSLSLGLEGPAYPVFLALKGLFSGGDTLKDALFLNTLCGTVSLLIAYYLLRRIFSTATAVGSLLLIATNAVYFEFTYTACSAPLFLFFTVSAVFFIFSYPDAPQGNRRLFMILLAGVLSALSALTMMPGILLFAFFFLALFGFRIHEGKEDRPVLSATLFSASFLTVFIPTVLFILKAGAGFRPILSLTDVAGGNPLLTHLKNLYFRLFMDVSGLIGWAVGVFVMLGILLTALTGHGRREFAYYSLGLLLFVSLAFLKYDRLYSFILLLFYIPLAVNIFGSGAFRKVIENRAAYLFLAFFIGLSFYTMFSNMDKISAIARGEPKHLIDIANYILAHTGRESAILSDRPLLPSRTGRTHVVFPDTVSDFKALLRYAAARKADYLLADFPEYTLHPFLRFLADPAMKHPLGLVEEARSGQTALYRFNLDETAKTLFRTGEAVTVPFYCLNYRNPKKKSPETLIRFIRDRFQAKDFLRLPPTPFQVVTQYNLPGCVLNGLVFRGPFGEIVPASLYSPPSDFPLPTTGRWPAVLLLSGNQPDGKASPAVRNVAENLARRGCFVLSPDNPGCGERKGFGQSQAASVMTDLAYGLAPAHFFTAEAMAARNFFRNLSLASSETVSLVSLDEDAYTALYAALLDSTIRYVTYYGGLFPFDAFLMSAVKPAQALVPGIAAVASVEDLLALSNRCGKQVVALSPADNAFVSRLKQVKGVSVLMAADKDDFLKTNFALSIRRILVEAGLPVDTTLETGFRAIGENERSLTLTIGPDNLAGASPSYLEIENELARSFIPDSRFGDSLFVKLLPEEDNAPAIRMIRQRKDLTISEITMNSREGVCGSFIEITRKTLGGPVLIVPGAAYDSTGTNLDTGLLAAALNKGHTVCLLPFLTPRGGVKEAYQEYYARSLFGVPVRALFERRISALCRYYGKRPDVLATDAYSALGAYTILKKDSASLGRILCASLRLDALNHPFDDFRSGYDGLPEAASFPYGPDCLAASAAFYAYGPAAAEAYPDGMNAFPDRFIFHYNPDDSLWKEQVLPRRARTVFSADSLFF